MIINLHQDKLYFVIHCLKYKWKTYAEESSIPNQIKKCVIENNIISYMATLCAWFRRQKVKKMK